MIQKIIFITILLASIDSETVSAREGRPSENPDTEVRSVSHLDVTRQYLLHLPKGKAPAEPVPLVIVLHGALNDGKITETLTGFSDLADDKTFVVAYPDANREGGAGIWDFWGPPVENPGHGEAGQRRYTRGDDHIGFIGALVDSLVAARIADPRRIYVTGISNGAFMTNRLSLDLGDRIAAIGAVAGTGVKIGMPSAKPKRPMPVIYFHGTADRIVGIDGSDFLTKGNHSQSAAEFTAWWAAQNECAEPVSTKMPDLDPNDGCTVERLAWAAGEKGAPVVYYRIIGGGHTWPGGSKFQPARALGRVCRDIDASRLMWDFFSAMSLLDNQI